MKSILKIGFMAVLLTGISNVQAAAPTVSEYKVNTPGVINYQGRLKSEAGTVYAEGTYTIQFRLYHSASGGSAIWGFEYNVYVKDGYFGVMLGAPGGTSLVPGVTLWQAMWFDDLSNVNDLQLYLGITVLQNENGTAIPVELRAESAPRQQFLNSPFAYRSVQAEYARRSSDDFDVAGDLTVKGDLNAPGKTMTAATASVGTVNSTTVNTGSIVVGNEVNAATVAASGALSAGSATVSGALSAGSATISGNAIIKGNVTVSNALTAASISSTGTISSASMRTDKLTSATELFVSATNKINMSAGQEINIDTSSVKMSGEKPFVVKQFSVPWQNPTDKFNTGMLASDWVAVIAGVNEGAFDLLEYASTWPQPATYCYVYNGTWHIMYRSNPIQSGNSSGIVDVLFIRKPLCNDLR